MQLTLLRQGNPLSRSARQLDVLDGQTSARHKSFNETLAEYGWYYRTSGKHYSPEDLAVLGPHIDRRIDLRALGKLDADLVVALEDRSACERRSGALDVFAQDALEPYVRIDDGRACSQRREEAIDRGDTGDRRIKRIKPDFELL